MAGFTALVLAGSRKASGDGLNGDKLKALLPVFGVPMIERVIQSLSSAKNVDRIIVCGPEDLGDWPGVTFFPTGASPARSLLAFLESRDEDDGPLLVTTADHPLLTAEMVDHFCAQTLAQNADLTVGMADKEVVQAAHTRTKRTGYKFRGGTWCSCNLFGVVSPNAANLVHFWGFVESNRKKPLKVVHAFGWMTLISVLLRRWNVQEAIKHAGERFGIAAAPVIMPWAEAAIDVDTLSDKDLAEEILSHRPQMA